MKGAAKLAGAVLLYLPALAFDLFCCFWLDVLNALFWGCVFSLASAEAGMFAFALALVIGTKWEELKLPVTKQLEAWAIR